MKATLVVFGFAVIVSGCGLDPGETEGLAPNEQATVEQDLKWYQMNWDFDGFGNSVNVEWTGGAGALIRAGNYAANAKAIRLERCLAKNLSTCWSQGLFRVVASASKPSRFTSAVSIPRKGPSWWHVCYQGLDNKWHCPNSSNQHYAEGE